MEKWTVHADIRNAACSLLAFALYSIPWILLQVRWPIFVAAAEQRIPAVAVTLAIGLGGSVVLVGLLAVVVPRLLAWMGWGELAWRWRGGAHHAAWFALAVTALHVGMRLPVRSGLQVGVTMAICVAGGLGLFWLREGAREER
jgi:hypothetical protein